MLEQRHRQGGSRLWSTCVAEDVRIAGERRIKEIEYIAGLRDAGASGFGRVQSRSVLSCE